VAAARCSNHGVSPVMIPEGEKQDLEGADGLDDPPIEFLISSARSGSSAALGDLLQTTRDYLLLVANNELPTDLRAKQGASDLVQETFLVAQQKFHRFEGSTEAEFLLWLRAILRNTTAHFERRYRATKRREASREISLEANDVLCQQLPDQISSPSSCASHSELAEILRASMERLAPRDRQLIWLREHDGLTFAELGRRLAISTTAARKAWLRAIERLHRELERKPASANQYILPRDGRHDDS
jgi:RNA polymerase sigma-70 factor, ECF subfamily